MVIDVNRRFGCHMRERYPTFVLESTACVSAQPLHHIDGATLHPQLVHFRELWIGMGERAACVCWARAGSGRPGQCLSA